MRIAYIWGFFHQFVMLISLDASNELHPISVFIIFVQSYLSFMSNFSHLSFSAINIKSFFRSLWSSIFPSSSYKHKYTFIHYVWPERFVTKEILGRHPRSRWRCIYMGFILICHECKYLYEISNVVTIVTDSNSIAELVWRDGIQQALSCHLLEYSYILVLSYTTLIQEMETQYETQQPSGCIASIANRREYKVNILNNWQITQARNFAHEWLHHCIDYSTIPLITTTTYVYIYQCCPFFCIDITNKDIIDWIGKACCTKTIKSNWSSILYSIQPPMPQFQSQLIAM